MIVDHGKWQQKGKIKLKCRLGDTLPISSGIGFIAKKHLRHIRREVRFTSSKVVENLQWQRQVCPHVRHPTLAQRTSGSDFGRFDRFERPLMGIHAAPPQQARKLGRLAWVDFAASATGRKVRIPVNGAILSNVRSRRKRAFAPEVAAQQPPVSTKRARPDI